MQIDQMESAYDILVSEYYSDSHKTSRNFDQVSLNLLSNWRDLDISGVIVELGCGRGRVGEYVGLPLENVIQTDASEKMLEFQPRESSLLRIKCDAKSTPFLNETFSGAFSFLFDPYNELSFYNEVFRILKKGGIFIGTLPAYSWGVNLRKLLNIPIDLTRFKTKTGETIKAPSYLSTDEEIKERLRSAGFSKIEVISGKLPLDTKVISPDITLVAEKNKISVFDLPIVQAFKAQK